MLSILLAVMFMGVMIVAPFAIMIASTNREERREIKSDKEDEDIHKFYELPASEQRIITTQKQVSEWDKEFGEAEESALELKYGITKKEYNDLRKIILELGVLLPRLNRVGRKSCNYYDYLPDTHTLRNLAWDVYTTYNWPKPPNPKLFQPEDYDDNDCPTAYRHCGCKRCVKRLIDFLNESYRYLMVEVDPKYYDDFKIGEDV